MILDTGALKRRALEGAIVREVAYGKEAADEWLAKIELAISSLEAVSKSLGGELRMPRKSMSKFEDEYEAGYAEGYNDALDEARIPREDT